MPRLPKIVEKKLGRHCGNQFKRIFGQYHPGRWPKIEIDPRQTERERLDTLLHEGLHDAYPDLDEPAIKRGARILQRLLRKQGYRRVRF